MLTPELDAGGELNVATASGPPGTGILMAGPEDL